MNENEAKNLAGVKLEQKGDIKLIKEIRSQIIGEFNIFITPFGLKPLVYADYVASGRSVELIENYITNNVLPNYANTHTFTSYVGAYTSTLRKESREIIKSCLNATEQDALLFVGSGTTGAINKLVTILKNSEWGHKNSYYIENETGKIECTECKTLFETDGLFYNHLSVHTSKSKKKKTKEKPLVFISIYEHHSNILPWRESGADIVCIKDCESGILDLDQLESELEKHKNRKYKIGSFSACSNINGIITDVVAVTKLLKAYGALAFFDYAAGAPYLVMNMNPSPEALIDGIIFSGHKMLGGPGTPGVLCIKRKLLGNSVPSQPGGGTVLYVNNNGHAYFENPEEREEGGTPDIIGSIRLGLVFQLKSQIGEEFIMRTELKHFRAINERLMKIPNLLVLGGPNVKRLPIFSFLVKFKDKYLHFGFISALLNDLFGIESRGGCACAGPYAIRLLNVSDEQADKYKDFRLDGYEIFFPGFTRLSINYFFSKNTIEYIISALEFISKYAIYFLPLYEFSPYKRIAVYKKSSIFNTTSNGSLNLFEKSNTVTVKKADQKDLKGYLARAYRSLEEVKGRVIEEKELEPEFVFPDEAEKMRWFVMPNEAAKFISEKQRVIKKNMTERKLLRNSPRKFIAHPPRLMVGKHTHGNKSLASGLGFSNHSIEKLPSLSRLPNSLVKGIDKAKGYSIKIRGLN